MPLKLVRRPKSPYWIIRGSVRGIRVEESTGTSKKFVAEEIRATREAELLKQSIYGLPATMTFAHAVEDYLKNGGSKRFLAPVLGFFSTTLLSRIDQAAIDKGAAKVLPDASGATRVPQFYTPVSAVLHHAARKGWCPKPVFARPRQDKGRIRWLEPEEADRLIEACAQHIRPLVVLLFYTGARIGEALWLEWSAIDLGRRHVQFLKTKNGEPRGVPLHPRVISYLANLPYRDGFVFRRPDGQPYARGLRGDDTSAGSRIKTAFRAACCRAGIKDFHPHDCRHTWATWHYRANRDLGALQRLGGWKTLSMVMRYAHTNVSEHLHTIDRLPGGIAGDEAEAERKSDAGQ